MTPVYRLICSAALALIGVAAYAQSTPPCYRIDPAELGPYVRIDELAEYAGGGCGRGIEQVRGPRVTGAWRTISAEGYGRHHGACKWFRACVSFEAAGSFYFETGIHGESELYLFAADTLVGRHVMGNDLALADRAADVVWAKAYRNLAPVTVAAGVEYEVYFRTASPNGPSIFATGATKELRVYAADHIQTSARRHRVITAFVTGWLSLLILYQLAVWLLSRNRLVFWYLIYMVSQLGYLLYEDFILIALLPDVALSGAWLVLTIALAPYCFFRFLRELLDQVDPRPGVSRLLRYFAVERLVLGVVWLATVALTAVGVAGLTTALEVIPIYYRVVLLMQIACTIPVFVSFYRRNDIPAAKALTLGNLALALCILAYVSEALLFAYSDSAAVALLLGAIAPVHSYLVELGVIIMSLAFAVAVGLVVRNHERTRDRETSRALVRMEMSALRAQMNPHFLFNGLNSIKLFVIRNQAREASDYLPRFSRLIRMSLENSAEAMIPLRADLDVLRLYVELEALRFEGRFEYVFDVGEDVDVHRTLIPPTLVQPYVENAIWHGLLHRSGPGGRLEVMVRARRARQLEIVVRDNGVGRAAARRLRSRTATRHKSLGMRITQDRLDILGEAYGFRAEVTVVDLSAGGRPAGTEVVIALTYSPVAAAAAAEAHFSNLAP